MIRIGIIGSESTHADAFSALANLPDGDGNHLYEDVRVTAIWGEDPAHTAALSQKNHIGHICAVSDEMLEEVDAVMVLGRDGSVHCGHALPFVEKGIPVWVDKPFTTDFASAQKLVDTSIARGSILAGGSTCKYCEDVLHMRNERLALCERGGIISGAFNFPGELSSPWGGIWFYGGHAAEMLTTMFGENPLSVKSDIHCGNLMSIVKYPLFSVGINFSGVSEFWGSIYAAEKVVMQKIDISRVYRAGFVKFIEAIKRGRMLESYASLLRPVLFLEALETSIKEAVEVPVQLQALKQYESWETV